MIAIRRCGHDIAVGRPVVALAVMWSVTKWHYSGQLASLKARIEMLQERVALALDNERDVKERLIEAQNLVVELNDQIGANEQQPVLLRSSNSTVAALDHLVTATKQLGATLATTRLRAKESPTNPLIPLNWRHERPDMWKASSSWPDVGFLLEMESSKCFVLPGGGTHLGEFASLEGAKQHAEKYRYQILIEEAVPTSRSYTAGRICYLAVADELHHLRILIIGALADGGLNERL